MNRPRRKFTALADLFSASGPLRADSVLYEMVQARKTLELEADFVDADIFTCLDFYTNWCLHSQLDRQHIPNRLLDLHRFFIKNSTSISATTFSTSLSIFVFSELRSVINQFTKLFGRGHLLDSPSKWRAFFAKYLTLIHGTPLVISEYPEGFENAGTVDANAGQVANIVGVRDIVIEQHPVHGDVWVCRFFEDAPEARRLVLLRGQIEMFP